MFYRFARLSPADSYLKGEFITQRSDITAQSGKRVGVVPLLFQSRDLSL